MSDSPYVSKKCMEAIVEHVLGSVVVLVAQDGLDVFISRLAFIVDEEVERAVRAERERMLAASRN